VSIDSIYLQDRSTAFSAFMPLRPNTDLGLVLANIHLNPVFVV